MISTYDRFGFLPSSECISSNQSATCINSTASQSAA